MMSREDFIRDLDEITSKLNSHIKYLASYEIDEELVEYRVSNFGTIIYDVHFPFDVYNYTDILNEIQSDFEDYLQ
jgi:hypothetical protein